MSLSVTRSTRRAVVNFDFARALCDPDLDENCTTHRRAAGCVSFVGAWYGGSGAGSKSKVGIRGGSRASAAPKCAEMAPVRWRERERDTRAAGADRRITPRGPPRAAALRPRTHPDLDRGRARCRSGDGEIWRLGTIAAVAADEQEVGRLVVVSAVRITGWVGSTDGVEGAVRGRLDHAESPIHGLAGCRRQKRLSRAMLVSERFGRPTPTRFFRAPLTRFRGWGPRKTNSRSSGARCGRRQDRPREGPETHVWWVKIW